MISATGRPRTGRSRAFSLLEILITLGIIALFTGFFVLRYDDSAEEESIGPVASGLQKMARKAKRRAYAFRQDQYVVFTKDRIILTETPDKHLSAGSLTSEEDPAIEMLTIPPAVTTTFQSRENKEWNKNLDFAWRFRSSGLSDPVKVRFSMNGGFSILDFHVLTAIADEESFYP